MPTQQDFYDRKDALEQARSKDAERDLNAPDNKSESEQKNHDSRHDVRNLLNNIKQIRKNASPMGVASLMGQIDFLGDMPFFAAFGAAMLKDLSDIADGVTVILPIIFGSFCSIFIFMMLLLAGANGKRKVANAWIKKFLAIVAGGIMDAIPGLDFLPIETLTVIATYYMELAERKNADSSQKEQEAA